MGAAFALVLGDHEGRSRQREAATTIQAAARSWLCRRRDLWWALAIHGLRARRRRRQDLLLSFPLSSWGLEQSVEQSPSPSPSPSCSSALSFAARKAVSRARRRQRRLGNALVLWRVQLASEARAVEAEAEAEVQRMRKAWNAWDRKMTKSVLKKSLQSQWGDRYVEQQTDDGTGVEFLDLKDGSVLHEHPNMRLVEQTRREQRPRMEKALARRLAELRGYR